MFLKQIIFLVVSAFCLAGSVSLSGTRRNELPISLSIDVRAPSILQYEPLSINLVMRNIGDEAIETTVGLQRLCIETTISVTIGGGTYCVWKHGWLPDADPVALRRERIDRGQTRVYPLDCFWQESFPVFDQKGKWFLRIHWKGSLGPVGTADVVGGVEGTPIERDATIEITVVEGTETDKKCLEYMLAHKIQGYLSFDAKEFLFVDTKTMSVGKTEKEKIETLEGLYHVAKNFQDSRYSIYALATLLSVVEEKSVTDDLRKKILALAEEHVAKKTSPKQAPHMPHPRVLYTYALHLSKESPERALTLLEQAKTLNPDFVAADRIEKLAVQIAWEQKTKDWSPEDFLKYREAQEAEKKRKEEEETRKTKSK